MTRLALPQVTLCAIDDRSPGLALQALHRSMEQVDFARVLLFTHAPQPSLELRGVEAVDIAPVRSSREYSRFVLRELPRHIDTGFVLVSQWDGFVRDASAWTPEFLQWDYIGAPWIDAPAGQTVGNGGFSLRSQRLLRAGSDERLSDFHPEDLALGQTYRALLEREHGVRFAPEALAARFAYENAPPRGPTFGFHGPYNLPGVLDAETLSRWLDELPDDFYRGRDARRLARALLRARMPQVARRLIERRRAAGLQDRRTRLLGTAAWLMDSVRRIGR